LMLLVLSSAPLWADDDFPPPWRMEEPRTVFAEFDQWPGFVVGPITPPDHWATNPGPMITPEAELINGDFLPGGVFPRTDVVRIDGPDGLLIKLENYPDPNPEKLVRIQVTYLAEDPQNPQIPNSVFGFNVWLGWGMQGPHFFFDAPSHLIGRIFKSNGWVTDVYEFHLFPNPEMETIGLKFEQYPAYVDQVVVDTWCKGQPQTEMYDFGDAPEGGIAYPSLGITGQFPTCITVGPLGHFIQHSNFGAFFGPSVDFEPDGNAGLCPGCFPPYDQDECFADGDAGLIIPGSFTIDPLGNVVPCSGSPVLSLGQTCQTALWGPNIDIHVVNNMPNQTPGFVNVLIDWDQNGFWAGGSQCPTGPAPEHVLVDFVIPNGFNGPLSMLMPPSFTIGPNAGYVWVRFSITERPVGLNWDGSGVFEDGETEDYLLRVDLDSPPEDMDFGDAPQPYPTLLVNNGARHVIVPGMQMGVYIDAEPDGQPTFPADGDDINPAGAPNDEDGVVFLTNANPMHEGLPAQVQITVSMDGFIDAWIDFEKNGDWANPIEQIFTSQPVTAGVNILSFNVPVGLGGGVANPVTYARFRYSSTGGLSYVGKADDGEVEDYQVLIEPELDNLGDLGDAPDSTNNIGVAMTAYPGVTANFPTVYMDVAANAPFGPKHWNARDVAYLGASVTLEIEADIGPDEDFVNNIDPANNVADLDNADDGVLGMPLHLPYCDYTAFDYVVNIVSPALNQTLYANVWFDWNRDGDWDDVLSPFCGEKRVPEWAVQNQVITGLGPGQHTLRTPAFLCWHPIFDEEAPEEIWMRITLSEQPWTPIAGTLGDGGSGPAAGYAVGETEDYLFVPDTSCIRCADLNCDGTVNLPDLAIFASRWLATCP